VEAFSGRGPVTSVLAPVSGTTASPPLSSPVTLSKPDVSATDKGINTFFGSGNRFSGTSAAAPHAAAVGALQLEANPALTRDQVEAAQKATARPVGAFGPLDMGAGLIDAQAAIASVPPPSPGVTMGERPPAVTNSPSLSFGFATTGDLRSVTCQVDTGAPQPCSSPFVTPRPDGDVSHAVTVRATDFFGQVGESTASFTVDTTGPGTTIRKAPKKRSKSRKAKFTFGSEAEARFECALDKKAFAACTSPKKLKVKRGRKHTFKIRAIDVLGNVGVSSRHKWKVEPERR
jgi:subtilisin family serine protease